jgi:hypothetical protein
MAEPHGCNPRPDPLLPTPYSPLPLLFSFFVLSFFPPQYMPSGPLREVGAGGAWRATLSDDP